MSEPIYTAFLEGDLLLTARGEWVHRGVPFANDRLSDLFHRSIVWEEEPRRYVIRIGKQQATFRMEDCAYFVTALHDEKDPWEISLRDGTSETLRADTLRYGEADKLYIKVKGEHAALFLSSAYQQIVRYAEDECRLRINGSLVTLR